LYTFADTWQQLRFFKGIPNFRDTRIAMLRTDTKQELFTIFEEIKKMVDSK
jgi:hypothetical protein